MAQTTSCFSLKAAAQLDNIVFYTGPPYLEKLLAQYASGEASDVSHHHTANLVGSTEAVTPPNVSMAAPTDAYSMFDPTLSELPDLPEDGGALQFHGNTGNDEGAWSPSELLSRWDGSGDSHYPTRHSGVRETEADVARMVDSSSDPVVGKALLPTLPHTPEPSVTASHHENDPESTTRGESEELFPAAKEWLVEKLGEDHPDTLNAMVHLASTYRSSGRWNEAEGLDVKAMETWRTVLGPEHPDTLTSTANLAATYRSQGWWMEAEELEVKVIEAWSRVLGTELAIRYASAMPP
ncbi:hypothetical protein B0A55_13105 [Friedmanniomyces simplex]|uniref:Kinesin light chain n=1 Tax=Friedmanniomyces simplex TaxID=329884 RepID=A0A4U0WBT3_9PEZI|nr:hypothetical protein B0A55_13105 [Friedmanniomyces simplex]